MSDHYTGLTQIKDQMRQMTCIEGVGLLLYGLTLVDPADFSRGNRLWQSLFEEDLLFQVMRDDPSLNLPFSNRCGRKPYLRKAAVEVYLHVVWRLGLSCRAELDSFYHPNLELMGAVLDWCAQWEKGKNLPIEIREVPHKLALDKRFWDAGLKVSCAQVLYRYRDFRTLGQHHVVEAGPLVWKDLKRKIGGDWACVEHLLRHCECDNLYFHECAHLRMCLARIQGRDLLINAGAKSEGAN